MPGLLGHSPATFRPPDWSPSTSRASICWSTVWSGVVSGCPRSILHCCRFSDTTSAGRGSMRLELWPVRCSTTTSRRTTTSCSTSTSRSSRPSGVLYRRWSNYSRCWNRVLTRASFSRTICTATRVPNCRRLVSSLKWRPDAFLPSGGQRAVHPLMRIDYRRTFVCQLLQQPHRRTSAVTQTFQSGQSVGDLSVWWMERRSWIRPALPPETRKSKSSASQSRRGTKYFSIQNISLLANNAMLMYKRLRSTEAGRFFSGTLEHSSVIKAAQCALDRRCSPSTWSPASKQVRATLCWNRMQSTPERGWGLTTITRLRLRSLPAITRSFYWLRLFDARISIPHANGKQQMWLTFLP